jgi:hypothetical protein
MRAAMAVGIGVLALAGLACTDSEGNQLTLEEYFDELQKLDDDTSERTDALFEDVEDPEDIDQFKEAYQELPGIIDDFVSGLEDLNPPDEAQDTHDEAVEAARGFQDEFDNFLDEIQDAESFEDLQDIGESDAFTEADERFTQACLDLEEVAADNDIDADLDCEDE